jgi:hypothetical protein
MVKVGVIAAALTAIVVGGTCGAAGASHDPVPGRANCQGQLIAISDQSSGAYGASGNAKASAGPGYFLHQSTHAVMVEYSAGFCSDGVLP